jgi:hypothetical protein
MIEHLAVEHGLRGAGRVARANADQASGERLKPFRSTTNTGVADLLTISAEVRGTTGQAHRLLVETRAYPNAS